MGETAARFLPWPGGGAPGNLSEGAPGDPLIPFPSRGKECPAASGPRRAIHVPKEQFTHRQAQFIGNPVLCVDFPISLP